MSSGVSSSSPTAAGRDQDVELLNSTNRTLRSCSDSNWFKATRSAIRAETYCQYESTRRQPRINAHPRSTGHHLAWAVPS